MVKKDGGDFEKMRGKKYTVYVGQMPLEFKYGKSSSEAKSDLRMVNQATGNCVRYKKVDSITGEEVKEIVSGKEIGGQMVVLSDAELDGAFAENEKEARLSVVEDAIDIPKERVKSHYYIQPISEAYWNILGGRMLETGKQLRFNFVEGRQVREAVLQFEGMMPVMLVLYFPSEVRPPVAVLSPLCKPELAEKVDALFEKLSKTELPVAENVRDRVIDSLVLSKLNGVPIEVPLVVKAEKKQEQTAEEMLALSVSG